MTKPLLFAALLLSPLTAPAHPDKIEKNLLLHFATGSHPIENGPRRHHVPPPGGPVAFLAASPGAV